MVRMTHTAIDIPTTMRAADEYRSIAADLRRLADDTAEEMAAATRRDFSQVSCDGDVSPIFRSSLLTVEAACHRWRAAHHAMAARIEQTADGLETTARLAADAEAQAVTDAGNTRPVHSWEQPTQTSGGSTREWNSWEHDAGDTREWNSWEQPTQTSSDSSNRVAFHDEAGTVLTKEQFVQLGKQQTAASEGSTRPAHSWHDPAEGDTREWNSWEHEEGGTRPVHSWHDLAEGSTRPVHGGGFAPGLPVANTAPVDYSPGNTRPDHTHLYN